MFNTTVVGPLFTSDTLNPFLSECLLKNMQIVFFLVAAFPSKSSFFSSPLSSFDGWYSFVSFAVLWLDAFFLLQILLEGLWLCVSLLALFTFLEVILCFFPFRRKDKPMFFSISACEYHGLYTGRNVSYSTQPCRKDHINSICVSKNLITKKKTS